MVIVLRDGQVSIAYDDGHMDVCVVDVDHHWVVSTRWMETVEMPNHIKDIPKDAAYLLHASGYDFWAMSEDEIDKYFQEEDDQ